MKTDTECHGLDTPERVCFYEQDFYVLSNFSSFTVELDGVRYPTAEHAYHAMKFPTNATAALTILHAPSAHEAFKLGQRFKHRRRDDWDLVKEDVMRRILRAKVRQHEYVRRKLIATGDRELVENSWRDDFWGWGPNQDGQNVLGKLWMAVRSEISSNVKGQASDTEGGNPPQDAAPSVPPNPDLQRVSDCLHRLDRPLLVCGRRP